MLQSKSTKYTIGQRVILNDGRAGKVVGVNPIDGTYQIITADNRSLRVKAKDIEKIISAKDSKYQESGIDSQDPSLLSIKDTPFDINGDDK